MIYGERIRLRAIEHNDLPHFVKWFNDPEVRENLLMYMPMSLAEEQLWFENMIKRSQNERPMVIEARQGENWKVIGNMGIHDLDWRLRSMEVGIVIGEKQYWNQGYGTEAIRLMLKHAFETLNMNRVFLQVYETNLRGIRAYEKAGFVLEGRKRQGMYKNGKYMDILCMSVLRSEWKGSSEQTSTG